MLFRSRLLLERCQGDSVQLPAHEGIDDTVYGSLAVYRQEIVEELRQWANDHSLAALDAAMQEAAEGDEAYIATWREIQMKLGMS